MSHYYECRVLVTPELAREWLKLNFDDNRKVDKRTVKRYAAIERWYSCANTIKFDTNKRLIDGQHRLLAIVLAGEPRECDVLYDCPPELALIIDTNRPRTLTHMLRIAGYSKDGPLAAVLNAVNWLLINDTERMTMDRADQLLEVIPEGRLEDTLEWVRNAQRDGLSNARFLGGLFLALGLARESYFFLSAAIVRGAEPGSAAQKFREDMLRDKGDDTKRVSKSRTKAGGGDERRRELLGRVVSVHDAFKDNRSLSKVFQRAALIDKEREHVRAWFQARFDEVQHAVPAAAE